MRLPTPQGIIRRFETLCIRQTTSTCDCGYIFGMIFHAFVIQGFIMRKFAFALAGLTTLCFAAPLAADASTDQTTAASDPDQQIKCRKVEVTGSLVKKGKVCKTVAEWKAIQENGNRVARETWDRGSRPTNGQGN
jgi:hypothetical protein